MEAYCWAAGRLAEAYCWAAVALLAEGNMAAVAGTDAAALLAGRSHDGGPVLDIPGEVLPEAEVATYLLPAAPYELVDVVESAAYADHVRCCSPDSYNNIGGLITSVRKTRALTSRALEKASAWAKKKKREKAVWQAEGTLKKKEH